MRFNVYCYEIGETMVIAAKTKIVKTISDAVRNNLIYVTMEDPKVVHLKLGSTQIDPDGDETKKCVSCGKEITYASQTCIYPVNDVACCYEHSKAFNIQMPSFEDELINKDEVSQKPDNCPACGGVSTRGRGFAHEENCPESGEARAIARRKEKQEAKKLEDVVVETTEVKEKIIRSNCPSCDGPPWKRGYNHKENCPESGTAKALARQVALRAEKLLQSQSAGNVCKSCGGIPRGRGFAHTENCPESTAVKLSAQRKNPVTCPKCGGSARGRGFIHISPCTDS